MIDGRAAFGMLVEGTLMERELTFGDWLKRRRRALDLTREALAAQVGCSVSALRKFEGDTLRPSRALAVLLAGALDLAPQDQSAFIRFARDAPGDAARQMPIPLIALPQSAPLVELPPPVPMRFNLPVPLTPLIGRAHEVAMVCTTLADPTVRLVTLTGPGGIGKTRVALQVAAELADTYPDGVVFVDLAPIADPNLVAASIVQTLGVTGVGEQPHPAALKHHLRDKQCLLVLDNFEQVVAAAPMVAELLQAAPQVQALLTSRFVVGVYGEHLIEVPPLAFPDVAHLPPRAQLVEYDAIRLFITSAQAMQATFALADDTVAAVAAICAQLDGLPLAIELAAARVRLLSPPQLLARLTQRLLVGGARTLPMRQQTLQATIDWSYNLLGTAEQTLFARLAVFVGGFSEVAAEAVCVDFGLDEISSDNPKSKIQTLLDGLASLRDQSLLVVRDAVADEPRFGMLETVREYARDRLRETGQETAMGRRHFAYLLSLVERVVPKIAGPEASKALNQLEAELPNLRAAFAWVAASGDHDLALRFAGALGPFWHQRGHRGEGCAMLEDALSHPDAGPPIARARALKALGAMRIRSRPHLQETTAAFEQSLAIFRELGDLEGSADVLSELQLMACFLGDMDQALALEEACLQDSRAARNPDRIAWALQNLADLTFMHGDAARGSALLAESQALFEELKNPLGCGTGLVVHAWECQRRGNDSQALVLLTESAGLLRAAGHHWNLTIALFCLGQVVLGQGDHTRAVDLMQESITISRARWNDLEAIPLVLRTLGEASLIAGDYAAARAHFRESQTLCRELGNTWGIAGGLLGTGHVALAEGDAGAATQCYTEALTIFTSLPDWDYRMRSFGVAGCLAALAGAIPPTVPERAVRIYGAASAQRASIGQATLAQFNGPYRLPSNSTVNNRVLESARIALGDETFEVAWAAGQALTLEQAIAEAVDDAAQTSIR